MKLDIKAAAVDLTPSFKTYIEEKLLSLAKFVKEFDETGSADIRLEISRSAKHRTGDVFWAAADLRLPKQILRAETEASDARLAVDEIRKKLHLEIEKYRTRFVKPRREKKK
ncbi:MAG: ribosome-associated translation inhibitor RaiA [Patescibacteria group bacterium]|nr:ribosome-associated translation inhibitor RaiA [Patescibacteria group bacterium]MDE2015452.1 ribosome-associated translation inhibitor RaiA [Patescibacteria group bacterium]MDE2226932.1 ribosome-associated translation inhibitor RaiA [Patescibacteria group bacterium]